jgi:uncharacterized membrane protein YheB (UPF0754 family)
MNFWIFTIPIISALIGWFLHWAAIRLLFHPHKTRYILGMGFRGLIPAQQQNIAVNLGKIASEQFISAEEAGERLANPEILNKILPVIEIHIDEFLRVKLSKTFPMLSMFIGDKTINSLKVAFMEELETLFPVVMKQYAEQLMDKSSIEQFVVQKVNSIAASHLETMLLNLVPAAGRNFRWLGALTGFIVGLAQVVMTLFFAH